MDPLFQSAYRVGDEVPDDCARAPEATDRSDPCGRGFRGVQGHEANVEGCNPSPRQSFCASRPHASQATSVSDALRCGAGAIWPSAKAQTMTSPDGER